MIGTLDAAANTSYIVQFFANATADPSGSGEGQTLVGTFTIMTDGSGHADFNLVLSTRVAVGKILTATATDPDGNTSEFSVGLAVTYKAPMPVTAATLGARPSFCSPSEFDIAALTAARLATTTVPSVLEGMTAPALVIPSIAARREAGSTRWAKGRNSD